MNKHREILAEMRGAFQKLVQMTKAPIFNHDGRKGVEKIF
jgi:hypothetical protein